MGNVNLDHATVFTCSAPPAGSFPVCATGNAYYETYDGDSTGKVNFFVAQFSEDAWLEWATPYGEWSAARASSLTIDDDDNIYVLGSVVNNPGAMVPNNGPFPGLYFPGYYQQWQVADPDSFDMDLAIVAFDTNREREWATLFGGHQAVGPGVLPRSEDDHAIVARGSEKLFLTGSSTSLDYYQASQGASFNQLALSDLSGDAVITALDIQWLVTHIGAAGTAPRKNVLYPNPVKDVLFVTLNGPSENTALSVFSLDGRVVWKSTGAGSNETLQIPTQALAPGVYILKAARPGQVFTSKFVKQ